MGIGDKTGADVLVTGATGFLGRHLVAALLQQGRSVRALGRNTATGLELMQMGADFRPVDLRDRPAMSAACRGVRAVVHSGALSSAWGKRSAFFDINVRGTANVVEACRVNRVQRLVHISSPSVLSRFSHQYDLDEDTPFPEQFVSLYSETKARGELVVQKAMEEGIQAVILRPKAIYGPGDTTIFPRIIQLLSRGKLPILGEGDTVTNITHVSDVVQAILLALETEAGVGRTFTVTGGDAVNLWEVISLIAMRLGYPAPTRKIPVSRALRVARVLELAWRLLPLPGEPPLTRYKVGVMAFSQTYSIKSARQLLGYSPRVPWKAGIADFLDNSSSSLWEGREPRPCGQAHRSAFTGLPQSGEPLHFQLLPTGTTRAWKRPFGSGSRWERIQVPAYAGLIQHPIHGPVLFDTGYSTRFFAATRRMPYRVYRWATPLTMTEQENLVARLPQAGVSPADVRWVIVSHFDPDHIGGLRDFPNAGFICHHRAWNAVAGKTGLDAMRTRLLPDLLPADFSARVHLLPDPDGEPLGPFDHSLDLFGDGTVRLVWLPGHAAGMLGAFIRSGRDDRQAFLAADACWSSQAFLADSTSGIHPLLACDKKAQAQTYEKLRVLHRSMPDTMILPSHCPEAWERYTHCQTE